MALLFLASNNSAQFQKALTTTVRVQDAAYNFSQHTFTVTGGAAFCGSNLVNVGTRFKRKLVEIGFVCQSSPEAYSTVNVTVQ